MSLTAVWRRDDGVEVPADVVAWSSPEIDVWMDREHQRFDRSGFTAAVEVAALAEVPVEHESATNPSWSLVLRRRVADIVRQGTVRSRQARSDGSPDLPERVVGGHWVKARFDPQRGGIVLSIAASPL
jgi:hypothetical protein